MIGINISDSYSQFDKIKKSAEYLQNRVNLSPKIGVILGSGLSSGFSTSQDSAVFPWSKIPNFPRPSVKGHKGEWVFDAIRDKKVVLQKGRIHYYGGRSMEEIVFSVRVMKLLGVETVIITNAAGGINTDFEVGDFVLITDHINMIGDNPLRGSNIEELGTRFPNLNNAYCTELRELAMEVAVENDLVLKEGVYVATPGPMYETPAEIKAYRVMGADMVGMSTVPEVIAARHCEMEVIGISCITNKAAGVEPRSELSHEEVLKTTSKRKKPFTRLVTKIIEAI